MSDRRTTRFLDEQRDLLDTVSGMVIRSPGITAVEMLANLRDAGWRVSRRRLNRTLRCLVQTQVIVEVDPDWDQDARFTRFMQAS